MAHHRAMHDEYIIVAADHPSLAGDIELLRPSCSRAAVLRAERPLQPKPSRSLIASLHGRGGFRLGAVECGQIIGLARVDGAGELFMAVDAEHRRPRNRQRTRASRRQLRLANSTTPESCFARPSDRGRSGGSARSWAASWSTAAAAGPTSSSISCPPNRSPDRRGYDHHSSARSERCGGSTATSARQVTNRRGVRCANRRRDGLVEARRSRAPRATEEAAPKVSPAPTVSTTSTGSTGTNCAVGRDDVRRRHRRVSPGRPRRRGEQPTSGVDRLPTRREEPQIIVAGLDDVGAAPGRARPERGTAHDRRRSAGRQLTSTITDRRSASATIASTAAPSVRGPARARR